MAQWFALVPLWLAVLRRLRVSVRASRAGWALAGYGLLVLAGAAAAGYAGALRNTDDAAEPRAELAAAAANVWKAQTGKSQIPIVAGASHEAQSIAFYSSSATHYWDMFAPRTTPWLRSDDIRRHGLLAVCPQNDSRCTATAAALTAAQPIAVALRRHAWGRLLPARRYLLYVLHPTSV